MSDAPAWRSDVIGVVVHPTEAAIWLREGHDPNLRCAFDWPYWFPDSEPVLDEVRAQWGLDAIVLRPLAGRMDREARRIWSGFLFQSLSESPVGGRWAALDEAGVLDAVDESLRAVVAGALQVLDDPPPATRRAWTRRGWFEAARDWADARLREAGVTPSGVPALIRNWGLSAVIRFETAEGKFYFKAPAPGGGSLMFANEAALLTGLAERFPEAVPRPVAVDHERVWMVVPDAGPWMVECEDFAVWEAAVRQHARQQRAFVGREAELAGYGCLDRRLERLAVQFAVLLQDEAVRSRLGAADWDRLLVASAAAHEVIERVGELGLPTTLVHGDLHSGNVGVLDGRPVFFDWTDACIGHPFLDLVTLLGGSSPIAGRPDARDVLRAAYLEEWRGVAPDDALVAAADLIWPVGMVHQAVSYHQMLPDLEEPDRAEVSGGMRSWLRRLVEWGSTTEIVGRRE